MARLVAENPHLVQAEAEWFRKIDNERMKEDEAGLSRVIKVESDDEVQPDGKGEKFNTSEEETMTLWNNVDTHLTITSSMCVLCP